MSQRCFAHRPSRAAMLARAVGRPALAGVVIGLAASVLAPAELPKQAARS